MARIKSDNRHLGILSGYEARWVHNTGNQTITPRSGEVIVLHNVVVNTTSGTAIILKDSAVGVIASIKASVLEGDFIYNLRLKGNLIIENAGGSDLTITFSND